VPSTAGHLFPKSLSCLSPCLNRDLTRCSVSSHVREDFVPANHVCRVIDAFVEMLVTSELGFERIQAADTGRPIDCYVLLRTDCECTGTCCR
jgi:hypothetical protein